MTTPTDPSRHPSPSSPSNGAMSPPTRSAMNPRRLALIAVLIGVATMVANGTPLGNSLASNPWSTVAYNVLQFGVPALGLTMLANHLIDAGRVPPWIAYPAVVLATVVLGIWVIAPLLSPWLGREMWWGHTQDLNLAATTFAWQSLGMTIYAHLRLSTRAQERLVSLQENAEAHRRQLAATQLLALQARVDPALLSAQLGVIDDELMRAPRQAQARLAALIDFLRAQQPHLDAELSDLPREIAALRAYASLTAEDPTPAAAAAHARLWLDGLDTPPPWAIAPMVLLPLVRALIDDQPVPWRLSLRSAPWEGMAELRLRAIGGGGFEAARVVARRVPIAALAQRLITVHGERASLRLLDEDGPLIVLIWPVTSGAPDAPPLPSRP